MGEHFVDMIQHHATAQTGGKLAAAIYTFFTGAFYKIPGLKIESVFSVFRWLYLGQ